ncbi:MAG: hypothetical protein AVDCRST_MAG32-70, partial [uncultured Nocardioides sp.]
AGGVRRADGVDLRPVPDGGGVDQAPPVAPRVHTGHCLRPVDDDAAELGLRRTRDQPVWFRSHDDRGHRRRSRGDPRGLAGEPRTTSTRQEGRGTSGRVRM